MVAPASAGPYRVSVIIPARDRSKSIDATLDAVLALPHCDEVVVVDAHSTDDTPDRVRARGIRVLSSDAVRGRMLNLGADLVHGEVLLFLDAGALPTPKTMELIQGTFVNPRAIGGCFSRRSGLFVWRGAFEMANGFRPYALFEDLDLMHRLRRYGRMLRMPIAIPSTSHRRRHLLLRPLYAVGVSPQSLTRFISPQEEIIGPRYPAMRMAGG